MVQIKEVEEMWCLAKQLGASTKDVGGSLAKLHRSKRIQLMDDFNL